MTRILILLLVIPLCSLTIQEDTTKILGNWTGDDGTDTMHFIFDSEGYVYFEMNGQTLGGKKFEYKGQNASMRYEIVNNTSPIELDLIITLLETKESKSLFCISQFKDDDTLELAVGFEGKRPTEFNSDNSIVLKRAK